MSSVKVRLLFVFFSLSFFFYLSRMLSSISAELIGSGRALLSMNGLPRLHMPVDFMYLKQ